MAVSDNKLEDPALYIRLGPVGRWIISHGWNLGTSPHGKIVSRGIPVLEREFVYQNFKQTKEGIGFKSFESIGINSFLRILFLNREEKRWGAPFHPFLFPLGIFWWVWLSSGISGSLTIF